MKILFELFKLSEWSILDLIKTIKNRKNILPDINKKIPDLNNIYYFESKNKL